jgi:hypothetical protein
MGFDVDELWGCGFNQFNQIDGSRKDIEKPQQITSVVSSETDSIEILWAGWADLLCTSQMPLVLIVDITREVSAKKLVACGFNNSYSAEKPFRESEKSILESDGISTFGIETLQGVIQHSSNASETWFLQNDGTRLPFKTCQEIAMTATGHVAVIIDGKSIENVAN